MGLWGEKPAGGPQLLTPEQRIEASPSEGMAFGQFPSWPVPNITLDYTALLHLDIFHSTPGKKRKMKAFLSPYQSAS